MPHPDMTPCDQTHPGTGLLCNQRVKGHTQVHTAYDREGHTFPWSRLVPWPEDYGTVVLALDPADRFRHPTRPDDFLYGPMILQFTRWHDGGVDIFIRQGEGTGHQLTDCCGWVNSCTRPAVRRRFLVGVGDVPVCPTHDEGSTS